MTFNVSLDDKTQYRVNFLTEEDYITFCTIYDKSLDFVVSSGRTIISENDDFDYVIGMRYALQRALESTPVIFNRKERTLFWDCFWETVDLQMLSSDGFYR